MPPLRLAGLLRAGTMYSVSLDPNSILGSGVSAMVYKATLLQPHQAARGPATPPLPPAPEYAIKFMPLLPNQDRLRRAKLEVLVLNRLTHPHVVSMLDLVSVPQFDFCLPTSDHQLHTFRAPALGLVMERAKYSLQHCLEHQVIPEGHARWLFQQLMLAIDYCHRKGIAQRDIKPGNMLLYRTMPSAPLILRVADFGWVRDNSLGSATTEAGTPLYMAPEIPRVDNPPSPNHLLPLPGAPLPAHYQACKADIWSCGVVLFHMLFPEWVDYVVATRAVDARGRYHNWLDILSQQGTPRRSWGCVDLLSQMLQADPEQRPTVARVMSHPWFIEGLPPGALNLTEEHLYKPPQVPPDRLEALLDSIIGQSYPGLA